MEFDLHSMEEILVVELIESKEKTHWDITKCVAIRYLV